MHSSLNANELLLPAPFSRIGQLYSSYLGYSAKKKQRLSYYREMRGSVLLTIGESVMVNLDHVCLNQSHYSFDVIEFQSSCAHSIAVYGYHRNK